MHFAFSKVSKTTFRILAAAALVSVQLFGANTVLADSATWIGNVSQNWSDVNNWSSQFNMGTPPSQVPNINEGATFNDEAGSHTAVNVDQDQNVGTLSIGATSNYTIGGSNKLTVNFDLRVQPFGFGGFGSPVHTIGSGVTLELPNGFSPAKVTVDRATFKIDGRVNALGDFNFNKIGVINQDSGAYLELNNGLNTFAGKINIGSGTLVTNSEGALGTATVHLESNPGSVNPYSTKLVINSFADANYTSNNVEVVNASAAQNSIIGINETLPFATAAISMGNLSFGNAGTLTLLQNSGAQYGTPNTLAFQQLSLNGTNDVVVKNGLHVTLAGIDEAAPGSVVNFSAANDSNPIDANPAVIDLTQPSSHTGGTTIDHVVVNASGFFNPLGTGTAEVKAHGTLNIVSAPLFGYPTVHVQKFGAFGGDFTGATFTPGGSVSLDNGAILVPTAGAEPVRGASAAYYRGVDNLSGTYSVGDNGTTSIYKGAAFGNYTVKSAANDAFVGTINDEGTTGFDIHVQGLQFFGTGHAINSSGPVNFKVGVSGSSALADDGVIYFTAANAGTAKNFTFDFETGATPVLFNSGIYFVTNNSLPSGSTIDVKAGFLGLLSDAIHGDATMESNTVLAPSPFSPTAGSFHLKSKSAYYTNSNSRIPDASVGASYTWDAGSIVYIENVQPGQTISFKNANNSNSWFSPNSDLQIKGAVSTVDKAITLGSNRRIVSSNGTLSAIGINGGAGKIIFAAGTAGTLSINSNLSAPNSTVQIGDSAAFDSVTDPMAAQNGTVRLITGHTWNVGTLTISAGTLAVETGSQITGTTMTVASGATVRGTTAVTSTPTFKKFQVFGTVKPGNSPGHFGVAGDYYQEASSLYEWEINSTLGTAGGNDGTGPGWDLISSLFPANIPDDGEGKLYINGTSGSPITIEIVSLTSLNSHGVLEDFNPTLDYTFKIYDAEGGIVGFAADKFLLDDSQFNAANGNHGDWSIVQLGNEIDLHFTASVPEPSSMAVMGLAALIIGRRCKRRAA